ncbi:MAG: DUF4159 domain-containing protein [Verrucomicrobiales bacterium]
MTPILRSTIAALIALLGHGMTAAPAGELTPAQVDAVARLRCNNLTYAGGKTSVCFADKFLTTAASRTGLNVHSSFSEVRLDTEALFDSPFTVISGEGTFRFSDTERQNLQRYLRCGGFVLASPGCSDSEWDACFRRELKALLPEAQLVKIPMSHAIFSMVFKIPNLSLKTGGTTLVEGIEIDGRLVMVYSTEGLNDAGNAKGCCCCGGNQILQSEQVNVNILLYALLH